MRIVTTKTLFATPFLKLVEVDYVDHNGEQKKWYGVRRVNATAAVAIAAITDDDKLIFVSQPRPMLGGDTIELPAGLMDQEGESVLSTAARELLEETGYKARELRLLVGGNRGLTVSSGLTDERLYLVLATGATKVAEPLTNEATVPILISLNEAFTWLRQQETDGMDIDYKLFGSIRLIESEV